MYERRITQYLEAEKRIRQEYTKLFKRAKLTWIDKGQTITTKQKAQNSNAMRK